MWLKFELYSAINPVAEFSISICSTPKFICSADDGVLRLLNSKSDAFYKGNIYKNRMMQTSYQFKTEFITNTKSERQISLYIKLNNNISFYYLSARSKLIYNGHCRAAQFLLPDMYIKFDI